ncbi:Asp-tRNA(Asn)/Glu-tRNA(Gln) amidotransferase subunit GatB [Patescibacteria group bacterium]|nr:Asp-tRNA(Asn)/Glu-tRNA(Gln) amidotransferase subunit GatB [Patescibacteria group bacterium]
MAKNYVPVIGLEIHAQMSTKTKMFCRCDNDSFNVAPNTNVCPICMGFPGQLPVINDKAIENGVLSALALNCEIPETSIFARKNYFYPDLPKGFQISQYDEPLSVNGHMDINVNGKKKRIRITRLHLEDDAGKLVHVPGGSLCDYNRSGTPLMEVVTEPDISSPEEASIFAREIQKVMRYVGSSDCDMEKGMMRFDVNVSVMEEGSKKLGTKTEAKNLNSFRALEKCLDYEIKRQIEILEGGFKVVHETRGWDDVKEITVSQRSKEEAHDYRYFPEPDLPPVKVTKKDVEKLRKMLPELPSARYERFVGDYKMQEDDARILTSDVALSQYFEEVVSACNDPAKAVSYVNSVLMAFLNEDQIAIEECKVKAKMLGELIKKVINGEISNSVAKNEVFPEMYKTGKDSTEIIEEKGFKQVSDVSELEAVCKKVLEENPQSIEDFKNGKDRAFGFLVGQVMKETKGQGNPKMVNDILRKLISGV